jgi:hypothetical protein
MVHLQKFHERFGKDGLLVYVISMHDDAEAARKMNQDMAITYPVFQGTGSAVGERYAYG